MVKISAYVITYNNERTVEKALQSLDWADEIVVVDSFSSDKTPEIAKKYADKFQQQTFLGFQKQYQSAATLCSHQWRFFLDADEEVPQEMADSIRKIAQEQESLPEDKRVYGFIGHRRNFYLGKWIMHGGWVPDRELRLYHSEHGDWTEGLHSCLQVEGETGVLGGLLRHYPYDGISGQLATIDKYSTIAAEDMLREGKKVSLFKMIFNPPWRFFRDFVLKRGFMDGFAGFVIAINTVFYVFIKHAKLYELTKLQDNEK